jgi:SulP family sulfate permease
VRGRLAIELDCAGGGTVPSDVSEGTSTMAQRPSALVRAVPIVGWLPHYQKAWLALDLLAGLSVWALVVPQALGYAAVVGVPAQYGLYTILGASVLYAVFASTRQVVTGPSASVAAVTAPVAAAYVATTSPDYLPTVIALTLCVGVVYVLLGVFRMGWVSNFLAKAVLEGFIFAVGFGLIVDQLPSILGIPKAKGSYWDVLVGVVKDLGLTNLTTLAVGAVAVGLLLLMRFKAPRLPRAFIVVILGILVVPLFDLKAHGVVVVGTVPSGLPSLTVPGFSVSEWLSFAVGALAIILVSYSESIATATDSAARHKQEFSPDQELVAQGAAWVGSSLVGGFPGCGSLSKTAVSEGAGQKTQLAGLTVAGLTVVTLLFLAGLFSNLPKAVLGAVVVDAALGLIHFKVARRIAAASRRIFGVFVATALGLFFVGVVAGIIFGLVLSLLLLVQRSAKSPLRRMGYDAADQVYVEADSHPDATTPDGVLVVKVDGPLFFADAATFRTDLLNLLAAAADVTTVVVDFEATSHIDLDGADMLTKVNGELADTGVRLLLTHTNASELDMLRRAGTLNAVGEANVFETARAAVAAATDGSPESGAPVAGAPT